MKKTSILSLFIFLLFLQSNGQNKNFIDQPYIDVSGSFDTFVTPNLIYIKIILSEKDTKDKVSIEEQENNMVKALEGLGLHIETDLSSSDMNSNFKYHFFRQKDVIKTREYILKVTTADMLGKVFLKLEEQGISNTSIQKVEHSETEKIKNICRAKAIENSLLKAQLLTKAINQSVGNAIYISDNEPVAETSQSYRLRLMDKKFEKAETSNFNPGIEFEKIRISAKISVKYIIR